MGTDAVYVFIPGQLETFYIRPDWQKANYILAAAITYLGRKGAQQKKASGGREEIWLGCQLADFIFEPFPNMSIDDPPEPGAQLDESEGDGGEGMGKIIFLDPLIRKRKTGSKAH